MEKSMRRVEKLVQATNSALAQMKLSLMCDEAGGEGPERLDVAGEDLRQCQEEFRSEAKEMLTKMEKILGSGDVSRRNAKAVERIKEINRKMSVVRRETGSSREKLLSLIGEEEPSPGKSSSRGSHGARGTCPCKKERPTLGLSPLERKEELRSNILETRDIVDRGFATARDLAQKVDNLRRNEKSGRNERNERTQREKKKAGREVEVKGSRGEGEGKREETGVVEGEGEVREGDERFEEEIEEGVGGGGGGGVIEVKRRGGDERGRRSRLRVQRLPSVYIRGGLQVQRVLRLELGGEGVERERANTGVHFVCHEQLEKRKMKKVLERVRRENVCWRGDGEEEEEEEDVGRRYVECSGCGRVMRIEERCVDPRGVEEVLRKCNFNVFDPRIDEFVEKCRTMGGGKWGGRRDREANKLEASENEVEEVEVKKKGEAKRIRERKEISMEDLSKRLTKKYREETEALEGDHLRVDSLLRSLLRKIDESKEVLEKCHLFRNEGAECGKASMTATKAIVVSMTGSYVRGRKKQQKLDKKDVKNRSKSRPTMSPEAKENTRGMRTSSRRKISERKERKTLSPPTGANKEGKTRMKEAEKGQSPTWSSSSKSWSGVPEEAASGKRGAEGGLTVWEGDGVSQEAENSGAVMSPSERSDSGERLLGKGKEEVLMSGNSNSCSEKWAEEIVESSIPVFVKKEGESGKLLKAGEVKTQNGSVCFDEESKAPPDESSEGSEKDYESDFESTTNEPEGEAECEEPEMEVLPSGNKLSTISEEDSELERKLSEEQKTQKSSVNDEVLLNGPTFSEECGLPKQPLTSADPKEKNKTSLPSEVLNKSGRPEESSPRTAEVSLKSTPTELVTSLKDILSALKDQFVRTESLAERLTENVKQEDNEKRRGASEEGLLSPWRKPVRGDLMERLESVSEEGGSSLGEVVMGGRRRGGPGSSSSGSGSGLVNSVESEGSKRSSWASSGRQQVEAKRSPKLKLKVDGEEVSYSEGEMESNLLTESEWCSSRSVGEIRD